MSETIEGLERAMHTYRKEAERLASALAAAERELEGVRKAYDAAVAYISVSVCDYDTTAEMWQAWQVFDEASRAITHALPEVPDAT